MAKSDNRVSRAARAGFTLMELMVVVGIIGILAGLVSTAMVRMMRQAAKSRTDNQIAQIRSAIMEYRHDYGRWPVPDDNNQYMPQEFIDSGDNRGTWKLKFCSKNQKRKIADDNSAVVERLLRTQKTGSGRPKRDILDLHGFSGGITSDREYDDVSDSSSASATYTAWSDAWELSEPDDEGLVHKRAPTLVWKQTQYYCDECKRYNTDNRCKHRDCPYYKEHSSFRRLPSAARREVAKPFYIMFDYSNDRVLVQRNPE